MVSLEFFDTLPGRMTRGVKSRTPEASRLSGVGTSEGAGSAYLPAR
jgi:hypothetical protein